MNKTKKSVFAALPLTVLALLAFHARAEGEQTVSVTTTSGDLEGTLTLPTNSGQVTVALILSGFGDWDRDGNTPGRQAGSNHYKQLAQGLAQQGIASVRFDKRGVSNDPKKRKPPASVFVEYANDAASWLTKLSADKRFSKVVVIGHGEGALVGSLAAQQVSVRGFVSIDGIGRSPFDAALADLEMRPGNPMVEAEKAILTSLKSGVTPTNVPPELASLYGPAQLTFIASWGKYDPAKEFGKLKVPVLVVQGGQNPAVNAQDGQLLAAAVKGQLKSITTMSLTMKDAVEDKAGNGVPEYDGAKPLSSELVPTISTFLKSLP